MTIMRIAQPVVGRKYWAHIPSAGKVADFQLSGVNMQYAANQANGLRAREPDWMTAIKKGKRNIE